ncbi:hypothetical protein BIV57_15590 [Mangrovactinospora gilvigrisea]|uniref:DUF3151 domain-containing protein n=1 Tax=Mangrovactinospora gilvigrisea TaxID=1428644 RepID=A0A1J7BD43_9ACTN|nr:DUF3151 domain-containing protein [Mangrovactinospora gilvigrisea]OIV36599.1 hypothetical protein BIV57_15590 [Mangrovactinospora gilvigrisea]
MTAHQNLLGEPAPTLLPDNPAPREALASGADPSRVAADHPADSLPWAVLAELALDDGEPSRDVAAYAYARTGYHRGLDALRRNGWKGHGPVPWSHEQNRGFLRALGALARASAAIGDAEEADRCSGFLRDSSAEAYDELLGKA